jgi:hypothetical protein
MPPVADPVIFARSFSYTSFEGVNPATPKPGSALDAEMNDIAASIGSVAAALADVRRSDGALKNATVTPDSFTTTALKLMAGSWIPRGAWVTGTAYVVGDVAGSGTATYVAVVAHTSAALFATDLAAGRWLLIADTAAFSGAAPPAPVLADVGKAVIATAPGVLGYTTIYLSHSTLPGTTPINKGGTGATSASGARGNLGAAAQADLDATNVAVGVINAALPGKANLSGATFTGAISLPAAAAAPAEAVRLDQAQAIPGVQFESAALLASPAASMIAPVPAGAFEVDVCAVFASIPADFGFDVSFDGGATYAAAGMAAIGYGADGAAAPRSKVTPAASTYALLTVTSVLGGAGEIWAGLRFQNPAAGVKHFAGTVGYQSAGTIAGVMTFAGRHTKADAAITHIRFRESAAVNLAAGSYLRVRKVRVS